MVTVKNCTGMWVISEAVAVNRSISSFFCSAVSLPLSMEMYGIIIFDGHFVEMLGALIPEWLNDIVVGMMKSKSTLFADALRFNVIQSEYKVTKLF